MVGSPPVATLPVLATVVTVATPSVVETLYADVFTGSPIIQNYSKDLGWITGATFNPSTQETLLAAVPVNAGSPTLSLSDIDLSLIHI